MSPASSPDIFLHKNQQISSLDPARSKKTSSLASAGALPNRPKGRQNTHKTRVSPGKIPEYYVRNGTSHFFVIPAGKRQKKKAAATAFRQILDKITTKKHAERKFL
jgi:hypothetical protein